MSKNRSNAVTKSEAEANIGANTEKPTEPTPVVETVVTPQAATSSTAPVNAAVTVDALQGTEFAGKSAEALIQQYGNKSNAIRAMAAAGLKVGPISKALGIRYQHARNVLTQPLKRVIKAERDAKNDKPASGQPQEPAAVVAE